MNVRNFYGIKNRAAIAGGENGESENEFLGESDSDDKYVYCESSYNNPESEESIQITEKKSHMQTAWVHKQNLHFLNKMRNVFLTEQK